MEAIRKLKEKILKEYPRLDKDSKFTFSCHPGVSCFNACCADVNIFLTPYDILRMKQALKMTSGEFLKKYTIMPFDEKIKYPIVQLQMQDNEKKSCHFVGEKGCGIYEDRPWACRMYPLGLASPKEGNEDLDDEFYFLLNEGVCKGHCEKKEQNVSNWVEEQGIREYNEMGEEFKDLTLHKFFQEGQNLDPRKVEMFFMACYHLDKFREFVFKSSFLDKFEIDVETQEKLRSDDLALLRLGYRWLRFALFGEKTLSVKGEVMDKKKEELDKKQAALKKQKPSNN